MNGIVKALFICPTAGGPMKPVDKVRAEKGCNFKGDQFCIDKAPGDRHVSLINGLFFENSGFEYADSFRNIVTSGIELMPLIRREIWIGNVLLRGIKYCDLPDQQGGAASGGKSFRSAFSDRGGLIAVVVTGGWIHVGDSIQTSLG